MFRSVTLALLGAVLSAPPGYASQGETTAPVPPGRAADQPLLVLDAGGHTAIAWKVLFTPDGRELISVSGDKTIRVWDVRSGAPLRVLRPPIGRGPEGMLYVAALAPDGRTLAVGGYGWRGGDNPIYLIALATDRIERVLRGHTDVIHALVFAADGRRLASGSSDRTARIWDVGTGRCAQVLQGHTAAIYGVAFAPDGRRLATASFDTTGRIWSVETGQSEAMLRGHAKEVRCVAWRPDGQVVATGGFDRSIRLWGPDGRSFQGFDGLDNEIVSLTFTADSRGLLFTWGGKSISNFGAALLDLATGKERVRFARHTNSVMSGALAPDGTLAATADGLGEIHLWKTADATPVQRLASRGRVAWSAAWSPDGTMIAWGNDWKGGDLILATTAIDHFFNLADLEFTDAPDTGFRRAQLALGSVALESTGDTTVAVKRGNETVATLKIADPYEWVRCFSLLPGDRAAVGTVFGLYLFDTRSGQQLRNFQGHTGTVWAVAPSPDGRFLLSASNDMTLRIWDPGRDEPLLALFVAGHDWIAWTPEGYYAASPGGERLMGWQVNHGPEALASFYPAADFHKTFYRPDVIKLLLKAGSVARALEILNEQAPPTTIAENLPPLVFITAPDHSPVTLPTPELEVRAVARGRPGQPVTALRLLVDGRPYEGQRGRKAIVRERAEAGDIHKAWAVQLAPGTHRLAVVAESTVSKATSDPVEVITPAPRSQRPSLYVLAVGISDYHGGLRLNYAAADARELVRTLQTKAAPLYARVETKLITDADATRRGIIAGLNWLKQRVTDRDVAVVFYSGHGDVDDDGIFYFIPVDVDTDDLAGTAVHGSQFKTTLAGMRGRVVVLLDACHAGAAEGPRRKGIKAPTDTLVRELVSDDYGVVVMGSSTGGEESLESPEVGHGFFTLALSEGLTGRADTNQDGLVYTTELDTYVYDRVKALSRDTQHPVTAKPASVRPFPLAKP